VCPEQSNTKQVTGHEPSPVVGIREPSKARMVYPRGCPDSHSRFPSSHRPHFFTSSHPIFSLPPHSHIPDSSLGFVVSSLDPIPTFVLLLPLSSFPCPCPFSPFFPCLSPMCYVPPARGIDVDRITRNIGLALRRALVQVAVVAAVVAQQQVEQEEEALYASPPPSPSSPIFRSDSPTPSTPPLHPRPTHLTISPSIVRHAPLCPSPSWGPPAHQADDHSEHNPAELGAFLDQSLGFLRNVDDHILRAASVFISEDTQHALGILADRVPLFPQSPQPMDSGW
jgi:hypothetical protein